MNLKFLFSILLFIAFISQSYAATSPSSPATTLATQLDAIQTMRADFIQTVYDNRGKAIQQTNGRMAIDRPGKLRWEIIKPIPQLIIANQSRLWIYDADLEQVTIRSLTIAAGEAPALLLSHSNTALDRDYQVTLLPAQRADGLQWFRLVPKQADNMFASVDLGFANHQIQQMRLQDHLGHATVIQFKRAQVNQPLPATLFKLGKLPANVDVIDETKQKQ
ncbi:MAG TPA: outer membrane lipoprotein chaperone LolA [Gammaproteobacteria bacterium]|jgi:outer membrane lipoprotein carrier protein|nr:outer membrane lipoprotein chaperone LolA [Gammaproteobacteria bacterium]